MKQQNEAVGDEMQKRKDLNCNLEKMNRDLQKKVQLIGGRNASVADNSRNLDLEDGEVTDKVQKQERRNWQLSEQIIEKGQILSNLNNEIEYNQKILAGEEHSNFILRENKERFESLVVNRQSSLAQLEIENAELERQITNERTSL